MVVGGLPFLVVKHPIELANIILILVGVALIISGPVIVYRTLRGMIEARKLDKNADVHWVSNGVNLVIAVVFFLAGILFVLNNLKGNPLAP